MAIVKELESGTLCSNLFEEKGKEVWESVRNGGKVVWTTSLGPYEIFEIFGFNIVQPELFIGATRHDLNADLCLKSDDVGLSSDLCGIIRSAAGYVFSDPDEIPYMSELPWGGMPKPDLLLEHRYCSALANNWRNMQYKFKVPLLTMERFYIHDSYTQEDIDRMVDSGATELESIVAFLENYTGKKMDWDKLEEMTDLMLQASDIWYECIDLQMHKPAPMSYFDFLKYVIVFQVCRGKPESIEILTKIKEDLQDRIEKGYSSVAENEEYRLFWDGLPMVHHFAEHRELFNKYNAVPVISLYPYYFGNPHVKSKDPLHRLVEYHMFPHYHNMGPRRRADMIIDLCDRFSVDGMVMGSTRTCQPVNIAQREYIKMLQEDIGLPYFVFEGDQNDPRLFDEEDFEIKFISLIEQMEKRK